MLHEENAHHPDLKEDNHENGLICFMNNERQCGPDCMAFQADPPEGPEYRGQWGNCMVLTNLHRGAKHLVILASGVGSLLEKGRKETADAKRAQQTVPPSPKGST